METTGRNPRFHDIIQICVLPLDSAWKPSREIVPFDLSIKPRRPENIDYEAMSVHKQTLSDIMIRGLEYDRAADLFEEWFQKMGLPENKRISPLAQNWMFDSAFIRDWLGADSFEYYFDGRYRDTMTLALGINDRADMQNEPIPYPKVNLKYLCSQLKVDLRRGHDAIEDCVATAEVYKRMLTRPVM